MAASDEPRDETAPAVREPFVAVPVQLHEALCCTRLPTRHYAVMLAVIRLTLGWRREADEIGSGQLADLTNYTPRTVRRALADLETWGMVESESAPGRRRLLRVIVDPSRWLYPGQRAPGSAATRVDGDPGVRGPDGRADGGPGRRADGGPTPQKSTDTPPQIEEPLPPGEEQPGLPLTRVYGDPTSELEKRVQRWVNVLGSEDRDAKVAWLREHLTIIEGDAEASFENVRPTREALNGRIKSFIARYWRRDQRDAERGAPSASTAGSRAPSRDGVRLAVLLRDRVLAFKPNAAVPVDTAQLDVWGCEIDALLREHPGLETATVEAGIEWALGPPNLDRGQYAIQVLSARALREKWDRIEDAARRQVEEPPDGPARRPSRLDEAVRNVNAAIDRRMGPRGGGR